MKRLSIQVRLAAWYFLSVAIIVALFATGSWFALKASMLHSIDRDLKYRISAVVPFIESHSLNSREQFAKAFTVSPDSSIVGVFVQITDDQANIVYESDLLSSHRVPVMQVGQQDGSIAFSTVGPRGWPVRVASKHVMIGGAGLTVHVVEPLRDMLNSLREYSLYFGLLVSLALLLTTTVGYWMSRRALAPVEQIRKQADAIDPADLTTRLRVPETDDELARLAQTLNAMLARIESGFRSIEQFTADASHELRAPLSLIITAGEVSLRRERTREELAEAMGKMVGEARQMSKLVEDLLALARGDASDRGATRSSADLEGILRELCAQLKSVARTKGLELTEKIPDGEVQVKGDGTDLRRLFLILIDNAIKYTETGAISVEMARNGSDVKIVVRDTGIGIEKDALAHVFDRFWRADKVRSRSESGAGLGLSLAAQIVKKIGGTISVESEVGQGSTFTVQLRAFRGDQ